MVGVYNSVIVIFLIYLNLIADENSCCFQVNPFKSTGRCYYKSSPVLLPECTGMITFNIGHDAVSRGQCFHP